uniref:HAT C-terminal dimerisation domain-containing protein n=1 Tax=Rhizophagus irregularis (strain DAOM 181602 / DAOM 197198 / MUCL 43194) TaxID=747089 RepID=U9U131_RHIID
MAHLLLSSMGKYPFDYDTYKQFNNDIWRYWCFARVSTNELGLVACRLFGICVNAPSVERLWSCMGFLQTNRRNRLKSSKALAMSKLRADITWKHQVNSSTSSTLITPLSIINDVNKNNTNDNEEIKKNNEQIPENENEEDENDNLTNLENEFGDYLQE